MSQSPTVSVLLPVFNAAAYLRAAVESVLTQTSTDFELIAIDDGSTDHSPAILQEFAQRDPRVRVITRSNAGIAVALNDGLAAAQGEFIARVDADDICLPQRFERQVAYMREHPECVLLGSRALLIDPFDTPLFETENLLEHEWIADTLLHAEGWAVIHPTTMMRTEAVRQVGGYRPQFVPSEDIDLFLRLLETGGRAANLPDVLLKYRQHPASANHTRFLEQEEKRRACIADAYERRGEPMPADWRMAPRREVPLVDLLSNWGWTAVKHHRRTAARRHAMAVLKIQPLKRSSWRLMYCALRGR
jgi:glycosyltransferase involved in cell wall biosynthesis